MSAPRLEFAHRDGPHWREAWTALERRGYSPEEVCQCCGEGWQYMGSIEVGVRWVAQFRHRHHPILAKRVYVELPCDAVPESVAAVGRAS